MKAVSDYFVHPDDHGTVADAFGKVLNGQQAVYDARMKCGTGKYTGAVYALLPICGKTNYI